MASNAVSVGDAISRLSAQLIRVYSLDETQAARADTYVKRAVYAILDYCNRDDLPVPIEEIALQMAEDQLRAEQIIATPQQVSSVTRGDTSIGYKDTSGAQTTTDWLHNYASRLIHYKRINLPRSDEE